MSRRVLFGTLQRACQCVSQCRRASGVDYMTRLRPMSTTSVFSLVSHQLQQVTPEIHKALANDDNALQGSSQYYFDGKGKMFRPGLVLLLGQACTAQPTSDMRTGAELDRDLLKLAMITEMIHTASLVHDDVIDKALTRRGRPSINIVFGHRQCVRAADFVLARASSLLASLQSTRVVEIISQAIEDLVKGEVMQMSAAKDAQQRFETYTRKTFLKTASLMARSGHAAAVLARAPSAMQEDVYQFGRHLGLAFQIVDDILDFEEAHTMGKETGVDLKLGLATAPVLFAVEEYPELESLIQREFSEDGDVEQALHLVRTSAGLERARQLAQRHHDEAQQRLYTLPESSARDALDELLHKVITRRN